jgi:hypothetical protein
MAGEELNIDNDTVRQIITRNFIMKKIFKMVLKNLNKEKIEKKRNLC